MRCWCDARRHAHTAQGLAVSTIWGDLVWCDGGWPGSCHEHELITLSGLGEVLDTTGVTNLLDRGFRGLARLGEHWHAPVGDRRTKDRLSAGQRAFNRCQAALRALVEQAIGRLANAWRCAAGAGLLYGSGMLPGRWRPQLPGPVAPPGPDIKQHHGHSHCTWRISSEMANDLTTTDLEFRAARQASGTLGWKSELVAA